MVAIPIRYPGSFDLDDPATGLLYNLCVLREGP
jgi:hypothetical protein